MELLFIANFLWLLLCGVLLYLLTVEREKNKEDMDLIERQSEFIDLQSRVILEQEKVIRSIEDSLEEVPADVEDEGYANL